MVLEIITLSKMSDRKSKEPYGFTHMWNAKLKATNEQTKHANKNSQVQTTVWQLPEGMGALGRW